jgi:hypothetical protein
MTTNNNQLTDGDINADMNQYLDKDYCYVFLVSHPENRLVCHIQSPTLKLVAMFRNDGNHLVRLKRSGWKVPESPPFSIPELWNVSNSHEFLKQAKTISWTSSTGLLYYNTRTNYCMKVVPDEYYLRRTIRGNEPNLVMRYLQLFKNKDVLGVESLKNLFPEKKELWDHTETNLINLPGYLASLYKEKFPSGRFVQMPKEEYYVVMTTHKFYNRGLSLQDNLLQTLKTSNARQLFSMIEHASVRESKLPLKGGPAPRVASKSTFVSTSSTKFKGGT